MIFLLPVLVNSTAPLPVSNPISKLDRFERSDPDRDRMLPLIFVLISLLDPKIKLGVSRLILSVEEISPDKLMLLPAKLEKKS